MTATFWNGESCKARRVRVIVGKVPDNHPRHWAKPLLGRARDAVEVTYNGTTFYLDDATGEGWRKVTEGKGSPQLGHRNLPVREVVADRDDPVRQPSKRGKDVPGLH